MSVTENVTDAVRDAEHFASLLNVYLWVAIGLFSLTAISILVLLLWPFDKEDE